MQIQGYCVSPHLCWSTATGSPSRPFGEEYYTHVYRDYDSQNPPRKLRFYARMVEQSRGREVPRTVHDIGCAFGRFLGALGPEWQRFGSDVSEYAIGRARQERPECRFAVADMGRIDGECVEDRTSIADIDEATHLHLAAAPPLSAIKAGGCSGQGMLQAGQAGTWPLRFGAVTAFDSLEHMPDVEAAALSIDSQLVPGGSFVFVVPVYDGVSGPLIRRLDGDPTHLHKWPRTQWLDWAARHFEIVSWRGILRYLLPGGYYLHLPTRLFRSHTPAIIVVCRRQT